MILVYLFLGLLLWIILRAVWGIARIFMAARRMRNDIRRQFAGSRAARDAGERQDRRQEPAPAPRRKKIDPAVAQDVRWEELQVSRLTVNIASETDIRPTSPVDDAVWEEV